MFLFVASFSFRIHSPGDASRGQVNVSLSPSLHFSLSRPPPHLLPCCPMMLFCTILSWEGEQTREQHGGNREKLVWGIAWDSTRGLRVPMVPGRRVQGWVEEKTLNPVKSGIGMVVAVKKLNPESMQGLEQWQSEVNFLGRLSHPNLVKLLGYCLEDKELLLVYEYMAKGSLENHLFRKGLAYEPLSWSLRLKIAIGAARGLAFLHTSEKQVIYRDFKASNILLDSNYNAKLSDFGLAKHGPSGGDSHVTTRVMGTYGYAAPEYVATGHLYVKSDVYGFGVMLLEMLSGLRALDTNRPSGQHNLIDFARPTLADRRKLARLIDNRLEGQYSLKGAYQVAQLTLKCLAGDPRSRPSMKEVVQTLEKIEALKSRSREAKNVSH
ncbi:hypothetical protein C4D60_Mb04t04800 [Musa balbisiana]|uniref:Protein kinase domain-containing protein n=1 Tax=Musa balbisiana TaxID=52838 RepID=A0A4S8K9S4_MUSBA|nr:hypothetical protein C4D60_Mb04t04800 [Musa balbisiana]